MSLFPFLAVLICTMGTLIVLLVLVVEQARVYASDPPEVFEGNADAVTQTPVDPNAAVDRNAAVDPNSPEPVDDPEQKKHEAEEQQRLQLEREEHLWRKGVFEAQRDEKTKQLAEGRLQLGHLEDHIRQLTERWKELQVEAAQIATEGSETPVDVAQQLLDLEQQRLELEKQIELKQQQRQSKPKAYAILPYEGPNGTRRRPIYLECTARGIILQPAGLTLDPKDLQGPKDAGNPLDAALRAIREYWRETGVLTNNDPYPLLLVRPDGVDAYSAARASLATWDDEFGYELVGAEKPLAFPDADPVLNERVTKAVELAKERQRLLASAMPKAYDQQRRVGAMRASRNGGFVPVDGDDAQLKEQADRMLAGREGSVASPDGSVKAPSTPATGGKPTTGGTPIASARGANWALHNFNPSATGWSRPIQVLCMHDRLVVLQEKNGTEPSRTIMIDGPLHGKMDQFAEVVRKHVEGWSTPPPNGYWKPMLFLEVGARGEAVFQELKLLLDNSGFEIRRAKP